VPQWGILFSSHEKSAMGGGYVVALDARTGRELWQRRTLAHPHSSVAVDVQKGMLFVGDNQGVLYAFEARSGRELWRREIDRADGKTDIKTTPTVIPELGLVVFGSWSGKIHALDEDTGKTVWEHNTGGRIMGSTAYLPSTRTLFVGSPGGELHAIDAADGSTRWTLQVGARIMSSPAVSGDGRAVVFGAGNGNLYAVSADTGAQLWTIHIGGQVSGSPALVKDHIYVTTRKGGLWALATHDMPSS
jgi:outer membrane protein assembly factor BamB